MLPSDMIRIDVVLGAMRVSIQQAICNIFETRKAEMTTLVEQAVKEYDWNKAFIKAIDEELARHAQSFVQNSMRNVSNNFDRYAAIQKECDELVRLRLTELLLNKDANG